MNNKNSKEEDKMQKPEKQNIDKTSAIGILTSNISTPLKKRKLSNSLKNNKERKQYKRQESITSKISQYNILGDSKIELVQFMIEDLKAKSEIEIKNAIGEREIGSTNIEKRTGVKRKHVAKQAAKVTFLMLNFINTHFITI